MKELREAGEAMIAIADALEPLPQISQLRLLHTVAAWMEPQVSDLMSDTDDVAPKEIPAKVPRKRRNTKPSQPPEPPPESLKEQIATKLVAKGIAYSDAKQAAGRSIRENGKSAGFDALVRFAVAFVPKSRADPKQRSKTGKANKYPPKLSSPGVQDVLDYLKRNGPKTTRDIAGYRGASNASAAGYVKTLANAGLVKKGDGHQWIAA